MDRSIEYGNNFSSSVFDWACYVNKERLMTSTRSSIKHLKTGIIKKDIKRFTEGQHHTSFKTSDRQTSIPFNHKIVTLCLFMIKPIKESPEFKNL